MNKPAPEPTIINEETLMYTATIKFHRLDEGTYVAEVKTVDEDGERAIWLENQFDEKLNELLTILWRDDVARDVEAEEAEEQEAAAA